MLATCGPKNANAEAEARKITEVNLRKGHFSVVVLGWQDILSLLGDHDDVARKHFSDLYVTAPSQNPAVEELKEATTEILRSQSTLEELLRSPSAQSIALHPSIPEDDRSRQTPEYDAALDEARDLIDASNSKQALAHLERLKQRAWSRGDNVVKFRILTNMGAAKLALQSQPAQKGIHEANHISLDDVVRAAGEKLQHRIGPWIIVRKRASPPASSSS